MNLKKKVGYEVVERVKDGYVVGLGTGSYHSIFHRKTSREDKN